MVFAQYFFLINILFVTYIERLHGDSLSLSLSFSLSLPLSLLFSL